MAYLIIIGVRLLIKRIPFFWEIPMKMVELQKCTLFRNSIPFVQFLIVIISYFCNMPIFLTTLRLIWQTCVHYCLKDHISNFACSMSDRILMHFSNLLMYTSSIVIIKSISCFTYEYITSISKTTPFANQMAKSFGITMGLVF